MPSVDLDRNEWEQIKLILGNSTAAPWVVTNPLLAKIISQLSEKPEHGPDGRFKSGNSREVPAAEAQLESKSPH